MKVHGLCIVKDEADIFEESMKAALHWCDHIYVFDNGSTDGTWELVHKLAERYPQIVPYKQDNTRFSDGLRADIFNEFRSRCHPGDWWCRLDADEFYIDDPRIFLAKIPPKFDTVWTASFSYYFTDKDAELYRQNPAKYSDTPIQQRLCFYVNHWSEPRFFRHRDGIVWTREHGGWPESLCRAQAYPVRIWVKHYAYRSPEQIEQRLRSRRSAIESGTSFSHEAVANWSSAVASIRQTRAGFSNASSNLAGIHWEERVVPASSLDFDEFDRKYVVNEKLMPQIPQPKYLDIRLLLPRSVRKFLKRVLRLPAHLLGRR